LCVLALVVGPWAGTAFPEEQSKGYQARMERLAKGEKGKKQEPERITFRAEVVLDPFSESNAAPADGKKATAASVRRGGVFTVVLTGKPAPGFHTFPLLKLAPKQSPGQRTKVTIWASPELEPLEPFIETEPTLVKKGEEEELQHEQEFELQQDVYVYEKAEV